jgi:hypothetical protein
MGKITAYAALTGVAAGDVVPVVDISDTSMAASGTTKKIAVSDLTALTTQLDSTATDIQPAGAQSAGALTTAARADHVHPAAPGQWIPGDVGWLAWAFDPVALVGGFATVSATIYLIRVNMRQPTTVTNVVLFLQTAGATLTAASSFAGLYAGQTAGGFTAGQRIGVTADQTTPWATAGNNNTYMSMGLSGGPFAVPAGFCWVAAASTGTTPPTWGRGQNFNNVAANTNVGVSAARFATNGTGATLPSTITPASNTLLQQTLWAAVS